jgi:hypothetical protein
MPNYKEAADRVFRLFLDLRRQAEAWGDGDPAPEIAGSNPDVATFNRSNVTRALDNKREVLVDVIAAILA